MNDTERRPISLCDRRLSELLGLRRLRRLTEDDNDGDQNWQIMLISHQSAFDTNLQTSCFWRFLLCCTNRLQRWRQRDAADRTYAWSASQCSKAITFIHQDYTAAKLMM